MASHVTQNKIQTPYFDPCAPKHNLVPAAHLTTSPILSSLLIPLQSHEPPHCSSERPAGYPSENVSQSFPSAQNFLPPYLHESFPYFIQVSVQMSPKQSIFLPALPKVALSITFYPFILLYIFYSTVLYNMYKYISIHKYTNK